MFHLERSLICIRKLLEKNRWKSDIFCKTAGHWSATLLKCHYSTEAFRKLLVQINYLAYL